MVRLFGRTARTLLAAGALGVTLAPTGPAAAESKPRAVNSAQVTSSQMRLEAMKVEMALLADYATYQLPLEVAVAGEGLELRGSVPDERTREQAVRVARQSCYLPVKDSLRVAASANAPSLHTDAMRRTVLDVLQRQLGDRVHGLEVRVGDQGQVILSGEAASVEDKLVASRALKGMPGCQSVINCLSVQPHHQGGQTVTMVTRDGKHAVHGELPAPEATAAQHTAARPNVEPAKHSISLPPAPTPTIPSALPPSRDVYVKLKSTTQQPYVVPSGKGTTPAVTATTAKPAEQVGYCPSCGTALAMATAAKSGGLAGYCPSCGTALAMPNNGGLGSSLAKSPELKPRPKLGERVRSMFGDTPPGAAQPTAQTKAPVPTKEPAPARTPAPVPPAPTPTAPAPTALVTAEMKWPPAHHVRNEQGQLKTSPTPRPVLSNSPAIRMAARPELAAKPAYIVSEPVGPAESKPIPTDLPPPAPVVAAPPVKPAPLAKTKAATTPPAAKKADAGVVPIGTKAETKGLTPTAAKEVKEPTAPTPAGKATPAMQPPQVYNLVKTACGNLANAVRVENGPDNRLTVHIHASPGSEQAIIAKLLAVPEIASSNLRMQIHLPK